MSVWFESDLGRYLLGVGLSATCLGIVGLALSRALGFARTEWRLLVVAVSLGSLVSTLAVGALATQIELPAMIEVETRFSPAERESQTFGPAQQEVAAASNAATPVVVYRSQEPPGILPGWVAAVWLFGSLVSLSWLAFQVWLLQLWVRRSSPAGESRFEAPIGAPFCGGALRPFIALPLGFQDLPDAERSAVLAHEEAHLALRHPLARLVADVVVAAFWWLPFAYLLRRELSELQERQCDEAVVRSQGSGVPLAAGLLRFAELQCAGQPSLTLSILRRGSDLGRRIKRLSTLGELPMKPKKSHLVVAATSLCLISTALAATLQVRPDALSEAKRYAAPPAGTVMTYSIRHRDAKEWTRKVRVMGELPAKPYPIVELRTDLSREGSYNYLMATPEGVKEVDNSGMGGSRGFDTNRFRGISLPVPARVGYEWRWSEVFRGQTMAGPNGETPEIPPTKFVGKVIAVDRAVKVPAGTYQATVVEILQGTSDNRWTTRSYWAKDVGIVKQEFIDAKGEPSGVIELTSIGPSKG